MSPLLGGATKFYSAALFHLRKEDFGEINHYDELPPAWPIRYEDMEPYYTEVERLYHVHGNQGEDPTEPKKSGPYTHPAVSHERASSNFRMTSSDFRRPACKSDP